MQAQELREKFIEFFKEHGHTELPAVSLIPENDPSTLFTTAGMQALVPFLIGKEKPSSQRLANIQDCMRTNDIEGVGDTFHHTFFEMMGNWSIGDSGSIDGIGENGYWKKEAINLAFEFLTSSKWLSLPRERLAFSVFEGDEDAPFDQESYNLWIGLGIDEKRIIKLPKKNNWWGQVLGPCGPNTEIFYWSGEENIPQIFDHKDERWIEIWNLVFMEYERKMKFDQEGNVVDYYFIPLSQKNVDTGMGLERILAVLNRTNDNYQTELFEPIITEIEELSGKKYEKNEKAFRIIADHIRASVFLLADGVMPSNIGQGYILRRLVRRLIRYWRFVGGEGPVVAALATEVIENYKQNYPQLEEKEQFIIDELQKEESKFSQALTRGLREFEKMVNAGNFYGENAFKLYESYGFPLEMTEELLKERNISIDKEAFAKAFSAHQEKSRTASAGQFKGGLVGESEVTTRMHTATHLLLKALREVLGNDVHQKGSNINEERIRFDFSYPKALTSEEIKKVEDIVNQKVKADLPVIKKEATVEEAREMGAEASFIEKYKSLDKNLTLYSIGDYSHELCGGPHVVSTGKIGKFKITKEESSSSGVRRIRAILE